MSYGRVLLFLRFLLLDVGLDVVHVLRVPLVEHLFFAGLLHLPALLLGPRQLGEILPFQDIAPVFHLFLLFGHAEALHILG